MTAPTAVLLARLAGLLESARLELGIFGHEDNALRKVMEAQELLEVIRDA